MMNETHTPYYSFRDWDVTVRATLPLTLLVS